MMMFKGILIFLTIFSLQSAVKLEPQKDLFEITNIISFKNFLLENYNTSESYYKSFESLTPAEKEATAKDLIRKTELLLKNISAMRPKDESKTHSKWDDYVLKTLQFQSDTNFFKLFALNGRLRTGYNNIHFDIQKLDSDRLDYVDEDEEHKETYCMHAWALYKYTINRYAFQDQVDDSFTDIHEFDNIRQIFYDLTLLLSDGVKKEVNRYDYCKRYSSYHQGLYNLYRQVIISSFEEFTVQYASAIAQAACQPISRFYRYNILRAQKNLMESLKKIMDMTKAALHNNTFYTYPCLLSQKDKSMVAYFDKMEEKDMDLELERKIQTIIIPEQDLSTTQSCSHNCNLDLIKNSLNKTECDDFLDCQYKTSYYEISHLQNSSRRYSHFNGYDSENAYGNQITRYGDSHRFPRDSGKKTKVSSAYSWGGVTSCDHCICTCVINHPSRSTHIVTTLSFREQLSDVQNNSAVVGFKFVKKHHMIHIQILESPVLPHGKVGKQSWKPLEKFDYDETTEKYYVVNDDDSKVPLELGVDYGHPEVMNLNDVMAPEKLVITGVRFRIAGDSFDSPKLKKGPIELQIQVTPIDFVNGQLINISQSVWIAPKDQVLRDQLILENPDNPLYPPLNVDPIITSNKFVKFQVSDLKKDAGQSTVPFFDGSKVTFYDRCLLSGIGLVHRGHHGSGGHLTIKIYDFDMSPYLNTIDDHPHKFY